jgi:hypothetical protein
VYSVPAVHPVIVRGGHTNADYITRTFIDLAVQAGLGWSHERPSGPRDSSQARHGGIPRRHAKTHSLEDTGKVVRCLINFARENPDKQAEIFSEMRCLDC